jgi:4-hydroxyphenylpyruvate dioxygenase
MATVEPIGIQRLEALHFYVRDLERMRRFYRELDFAEVARSGAALDARGRQRSAVFQAGHVRIVCSQPVGEGGRASRWLRKHPEGVGSLVFEVEDCARTFRLLEERGGTPVTDVEEVIEGGGAFRTFNVTTPFGDTTFRFVERRGFAGLYPGFEPAPPSGAGNRFGFGEIDHVTSNFETMKPALLWMEHVLGFEEFWEVQFHTAEAASEARRQAMQRKGSGLRSVVMRDPRSGVKFANNEPWRPAFKSSQINIFHEDQRGDGVQHAALTVRDIVPAVRAMREAGVRFMPTPGTYYDALPERLKEIGVGAIEEDVATLRELEILVDGAAPGAYLLQIFLQEQAGLWRDPEAGPFFYEIIQRKGDRGFGAGNFRALFESIERAQQEQGRA